jgi:hypothetical protein
MTGVAAIACGWFHSLAIKSNGTVVVWGDNTFGQTNAPAGLTNATSIAGGNAHSLSLESNATMVAWGNNYFGQTNFPPGLIQVLAIAAGGYHSLAVSTPTIPPLVFNLIPPNLQMTATGFQLQVDGAAGITPVVIYASTNMTDWTPIFTNPPVAGSLPFLDSAATNFPRRFYRAEEP